MSLSQHEKENRRIIRNNEKWERIARKKKQEESLQRADIHFINVIRHEKQQRELQEQLKKEIGEIKDNILIELRKNNPFTYPQFLIVWDAVTENFQQIQQDLYRGKINKSDITAAFQYIGNFSKELINEYWNEKLLSMEA